MCSTLCVCAAQNEAEEFRIRFCCVIAGVLGWQHDVEQTAAFAAAYASISRH